jgi:ArsR family transcriptional regulator, arsenate/arsenite/antimonite-responsive transcriptional repressor
METTDVVAALAALAQDNRLNVFRLLVQAGQSGMPAGQVAEVLGVAPNALILPNLYVDIRRHIDGSPC